MRNLGPKKIVTGKGELIRAYSDQKVREKAVISAVQHC
jgi:hypothetical protein